MDGIFYNLLIISRQLKCLNLNNVKKVVIDFHVKYLYQLLIKISQISTQLIHLLYWML